MSRVAENIKKLRIKKELSQKQLAKKLGVAESFVNEIETGRRVVNEAVIDRISKILGENLNDINMYAEETEETKTLNYEHKKNISNFNPKDNKKDEVNEVWGNALSNILKNVPVYDYSMSKVIENREMVVVSNKIRGFAPNKVFFIKIDDNDMAGFRILKGDIAFCHAETSVEGNSILFLEHKGQRKIRQIKKLDNEKVLLVSNGGALITETAYIRDLKPIGRLSFIELNL